MNYTTRLLITFLFVLFSGLKIKAQTTLTITVDINKKAQTIQNFGASGCWYSEPVGRYWPDSVKERMAELLFSKSVDKNGDPRGIGLSAWRFNIGAGTAEQHDSSGIKDINRRVECFLNADGTYNWQKQQGYLWFTRKALAYNVENLIAFVNSPPVYYTKNGLGFKTTKENHTNLKDDQYDAYAQFLTTILAHFDREHIHFNYISPVNEPQWQWYDKFGEGSQEGSPYTNKEIYRVINALDKSLTSKQLSTQIMMPEAGMLTYLYGMPQSETGTQVQQFWQATSPLYLGNLQHLGKFVAGHGYFTENGEQNTITIRKQLADTAAKYQVSYWQSEYSMLSDGFKEGSKDKRNVFDCAMFLAKLIHHDLVDGHAAAWQFWNAWEPGKADYDTRYYLLALHPSPDFRSGTYEITKNLWALGNFSRFIRPGMVRIKLTDTMDKELLASAYCGEKSLVMVLINNSMNSKQVKFSIPSGRFSKTFKPYITSAAADDNMKLYPVGNINDTFTIKPRTINTLVFEEYRQYRISVTQ